MGNTTSDTNITQQNNQLYVNKNSLKAVSEQINQQIANTLIKNAKSCSADINNNQTIMIKGFTTKGDFNFSTQQKEQAGITFSCVQPNTVRNNAGSEIISQMMNDLNNNASNTAFEKMDTAAQATAQAGWGAIGNVQTNTNTNTINNYQSVTENHKDIENVVKNVVENNFTSESISSCISQANDDQNINLQEVNVGGQTVIAIQQDQAANVVMECIQENNIGNAIVNNAANSLGLKVSDETFSKITQENKSAVSAESGMTGVFQDLFSGLSSMFGSLLIPFIGCSCVLCVFILVIGYFLTSVGNNPEIIKMAATAAATGM